MAYDLVMRRGYANVTKFFDRHGKIRWRFRKAGLPAYYFKSVYGTPDFEAEWRACYSGAGWAAAKAPALPCPFGNRSFVYFVGGDDGPVKIGFSAGLAQRLDSIQSHSPTPVRLLAVRPGGQKEERRYHQRFFRHRLHGEWFDRAPEIIAEMDILRTSDVQPPRIAVSNPLPTR